MIFRRKALNFTAGLSAILALTACANGSSAVEPAAPSSVNEESAPVSTPSRVSPLQEYQDLLWGTGLDQETQLREHEAQQIRREELISECMAELGFEYLPHFNSQTMQFQSSELRLDDPEWVSQYGYGLSSGLSLGANFAPGLLVIESGGDFGPNEALLAEMTDAERDAWMLAFTGTLFTADGFFDETLLDTLGESCRSQASAQAHQEFNPQADERSEIANQFADLISEMTQLHLRVTGLWDHDPIISEADRDWAACMAEAGYSRFARQHDAQRTVSDMREGALANLEDWQSATPANTPRLAQIQELEIEIALADLNCRVATDFRARQDAALTELETQFVTDHREALTALRSALEQLS